jgi:hypothetical protein
VQAASASNSACAANQAPPEAASLSLPLSQRSSSSVRSAARVLARGAGEQLAPVRGLALDLEDA